MSLPVALMPVPLPLTPLIGRQREIELVCALLAQPAVRLVTVTGPGGVGKTRIAVHVAQDTQAVDNFDHVAFVSLAALRDPDQVLPSIAQALGLQNLGHRSPVEHLARVLAVRRLLLILDNLEHLLACAPQVTHLLSFCPRLTVLATSREALRVSGEREVPVPPLPVPVRSDPASLAAILESEAITLLVQRAQAVLPDFAVTVENAPDVVQICWRLDGLPLAIELAAARVKLLPPDSLLARLDHRLTLLTGGARDLPERQQTLRATVNWSYELLAASEQRLFRGLAVFPAGWTLEAAEAVLGARLSVDVLDGIASLLDKSLLVRAGYADGPPRYRMLETVREFAAEQLSASGEADDLHQRLIDWALTLFDPDLPTFFGTRHHAVFARVIPELDNLRAAVDWGVERYPAARLLAVHLGWHYSVRSLLGDAVSLAERTLAAAVDDPPQLRVNLLLLLGFVAWLQVKYELALQYASRGEELAAEAKLPDSGDFLLLRWLHACYDGTFTEAEPLLERAFELLAPVERAVATSRVQSFQAASFYRHGHVERAAAVAPEALAAARAQNDNWSAGIAQFVLAQLASDRGDVTGAMATFVDTARLGWSVADVRQLAWCMWGIGVLLARHQHPQPAVTFLAVATTLQELRGDLVVDYGPATAGQTLAELRSHLPAETFDAAMRAGQGMTAEEAIEFAAALEFPAPPVVTFTPYGLSPRELEILRLLVDDRSTQEMAEILYISQRTVTTHISHIFNKLGVNSRAAAVALALRQRLV